jgi:hypothetical protein
VARVFAGGCSVAVKLTSATTLKEAVIGPLRAGNMRGVRRGAMLTKVAWGGGVRIGLRNRVPESGQ